jgi:hypothetical protein
MKKVKMLCLGLVAGLCVSAGEPVSADNELAMMKSLKPVVSTQPNKAMVDGESSANVDQLRKANGKKSSKRMSAAQKITQGVAQSDSTPKTKGPRKGAAQKIREGITY